jgi:hypothetical protein
MPIIPDPNLQKWKGQFKGQYYGDFVQSFNIDLETSPGTIKSSPSLTVLNDRTSEDYGLVTNFILSDASGESRWYASCVNEGATTRPMLATTSSTLGAFAEVTSANAPADNTQCYDMIVHEKANGEDRLIVVKDDDLSILNTAASPNAWTASWWKGTLGQAGLTGTSTRLARLNRLLAILDKNLVHTIDSADTVQNSFITFDANLTGIHAMTSLDRFWFGFRNTLTGAGAIAEWDGTNLTYNNLYKVSGFPVAGFIIRNLPYYVLSNGRLAEWNGSGFSEFDDQVFPTLEDQTVYTSHMLSGHNAYVDGDMAYISLPAPSPATNIYKARSGIWNYNPFTNILFHRYGFSTATQYGGSYQAGSVGAIVPTYDSNKFVCAYTTAKTLVGTTDYIISRVTSLTNVGGTVCSSFVTPLIMSNEVEDYWQNVWLKYAQLSTASAKIILKYRTTVPGRNKNLATLTWTSATGGTLSAAGTAKVGDEIELLTGPSAGSSYHIATKTGTAITIDETPVFNPANTNTAYVLIDDWIKLSDNNPITDQTTNYKKMMTATTDVGSGTHVQFKIEFRDVNNLIEIQQLMVINKTQTSKDL